MSNKIVRTICYFTSQPSSETAEKLSRISNLLSKNDYTIQTKRICVNSDVAIKELREAIKDDSILLSVGSLGFKEAKRQLNDFLFCENVFFNLDLTSLPITEKQVDILFQIIKEKPEKTFNFTYVFNNKPSSPYFPSANYQKDGFSVGLQPIDLSEECNSVEDWLQKMKQVWDEIFLMFKDEKDFLGIDSSTAPLFEGKSSLVHFLKKIGYDFSSSVLTDIYLQISKFLKEKNPKPVGLCGLMFPCLEDFGLAEEYEKGNFSLERNIFLSLHSGLGIDTYPIAIDEKPEKVLNVLKLMQGLSNKHKKPLSIRFVSDGKAKIGDKTDFKNQYLKDVVVGMLSNY